MKAHMTAENRRQAMLDQMGIKPWFPRASLPGAGGSHVYDVATGNVTIPELPSRPNAAAPLAEPSLASDASDNQKQTQTLRSDLTEIDENKVEFAFSWFSLDRRLAVLAALPAGSRGVSGSCSKMLQRMLAALSADYQDKVLKEHSFHWPFPDDLGLPSGQLAARQAVDGFVARRLREQSAAVLLVLSDEKPPFLYPQGNDAANDNALIVHRQFGFAMLRTHSLHAMDSNNELKRSAWQSMRILHERLNRTTE
jgi:hypothetical protein